MKAQELKAYEDWMSTRRYIKLYIGLGTVTGEYTHKPIYATDEIAYLNEYMVECWSGENPEKTYIIVETLVYDDEIRPILDFVERSLMCEVTIDLEIIVNNADDSIVCINTDSGVNWVVHDDVPSYNVDIYGNRIDSVVSFIMIGDIEFGEPEEIYGCRTIEAACPILNKVFNPDVPFVWSLQ